jgi:HlyD family secretion protein
VRAPSRDAKAAPAPDQPSAPAVAVSAHPLERRFWTPWRVRGAVIAGALLVGLTVWWVSRPGTPELHYQVAPARIGTVTRTLHGPGTLAPRNVTDVTATMDGRLQNVFARVGERVTAGALLARFDPAEAQAQLAEAQADIASEQAQLQRYEADITEARADLAREAALRKYNIAAPGTYERAEARLARAVAGADTVRADLREAQLRAAAARARLTKLDVRAPFSGVVLKRNVQAGQYAGGQSQALFTMAADLSQLQLGAEFPETALGAVHPGQQATFTVPAYPRQSFSAVVSDIDLLPKKQTADSNAKSVYGVNLIADNPDDVLRPGMTADVAVITAQARNVVTVPSAATSFTPPAEIARHYPPPKPTPTGTATRVWVMDGSMPAPRDVTTGLSDGRVTQIVAGLKPGEKVITNVQFGAN